MGKRGENMGRRRRFLFFLGCSKLHPDRSAGGRRHVHKRLDFGHMSVESIKENFAASIGLSRI